MNSIILFSSILIAIFAIQASKCDPSNTPVNDSPNIPNSPDVGPRPKRRRFRRTTPSIIASNSIPQNIHGDTQTMGATGTTFVSGDAANQLNPATGVQQSTILQNDPMKPNNNVADRFLPTTPHNIASNSIPQNIRGETQTMGATGTTFVSGESANQLNPATDRNVGDVQQSTILQNDPIKPNNNVADFSDDDRHQRRHDPNQCNICRRSHQQKGVTRAPTYQSQSSNVFIPSGNVVHTLVAPSQHQTTLGPVYFSSAPLTVPVVTPQIQSGLMSSCGINHLGGQHVHYIPDVATFAHVQTPIYTTVHAPIQNQQILVL